MKFPSQDSIKSIKILTRITDPYEILDQTSPAGKFIYKQYQKINVLYEKILAEIKIDPDDPLILYEYTEKFALTGDLSNEIQYNNPEKIVIIARHKDDEMVCSLRSEKHNVRKILEKALVGIDGHGGGHEHACGAGIKKTDFQRFIDAIRENA
jgi:hypothetical protein